jgi:hypothetical protein
MLGNRAWKYFKNNPDGVALVCTLEGTGAASAKIFPNGKIIIDCAAAQVNKYVNLTTPLAMRLIDMHTIHGDATACTVQALNTASAITDAVSLAASDKDIDRAGSIDDDYDSFAADDNDLRITIGTGAFTGRVVMQVEFI